MRGSQVRRSVVLGVLVVGWACSGSPTTPGQVAPPIPGGLQAQGDPSLNIIRVGTGSGSIVSDPAGISCPRTCGANFAPGTVVTLTATPNRTSVFAGWTDACAAAGANPVATVTMDADHYCTATFNKKNGPPPTTGGPDLIAAFNGFPSRAKPGYLTCPSVLTTNQGDADAGASTTRVLFSRDGVIDGSDEVLWDVSVPALPAGVVDRQIDDDPTTPIAFCVTFPTGRGKYYYFVIADLSNAVAETNEANNVKTYAVTIR